MKKNNNIVNEVANMCMDKVSNILENVVNQFGLDPYEAFILVLDSLDSYVVIEEIKRIIAHKSNIDYE